MAKTEEDNRDIFDKALDYTTPVAGAVGFYLGRKAARKFGKIGDRNFSSDPAKDMEKAQTNNNLSRNFRDHSKSTSTDYGRDYYKQKAKEHADIGSRARNRVLANNAYAAVTGGTSALVTDAAKSNKTNKRRK